MIIFGEFIRQKRLEKGWSQSDMAKILNCSVSNVKHHENRGGSPLFETAQRLSKLLNFSLDQEFKFKASPSRPEDRVRLGGSIKKPPGPRKRVNVQKMEHLEGLPYAVMLRKKRREMGLSTYEAAARVGCCRQSITEFERGRSVPRLKTRIALANLYQFDVDEWDYTEMTKIVSEARAAANDFTVDLKEYDRSRLNKKSVWDKIAGQDHKGNVTLVKGLT